MGFFIAISENGAPIGVQYIDRLYFTLRKINTYVSKYVLNQTYFDFIKLLQLWHLHQLGLTKMNFCSDCRTNFYSDLSVICQVNCIKSGAYTSKLNSNPYAGYLDIQIWQVYIFMLYRCVGEHYIVYLTVLFYSSSYETWNINSVVEPTRALIGWSLANQVKMNVRALT